MTDIELNPVEVLIANYLSETILENLCELSSSDWIIYNERGSRYLCCGDAAPIEDDDGAMTEAMLILRRSEKRQAGGGVNLSFHSAP